MKIIKRCLQVILFSQILLIAQTKETVVAKFGKHTITLEEYKTAYLELIKQPRVFDSKELREQYLDELIISKLLVDEASKLNFDKDELMQYKINAYRNKCMRLAHYEKVIKPKVKVEENDVEEAYLFTQEERKISHLFAETKEKADSLYMLLGKGVAFDSLAKRVFNDSLLANSGGDLGWVNWDQLDYDLAQAAFRQPVNLISQPIKSSFGYHILKVTDFKKKPMISSYEYEIHKRKAKYLLEYKVGEKIAYEYIGKMLKNADVIIYPKVLQFVNEKLSQKLKRKPNQFDQMRQLQLRDYEVRYVETNLWDERNQIMAVVNGKNYTVGDFMGELSFIPYDVVFSDFKKTFDFALRDFLINQESEKLGLQKSRSVQIKTQLYRNFLVELEFRRKLVHEVKIDESEVKNYYEQNKSKYNGATYEQMEEIIMNFVLDEKKRQTIPNHVKTLMKNMKIEKHLDVIHKYYDSILKG